MTHHTVHTAPTVTVVAQPTRDNNKYASNPNVLPFLMSHNHAMQNNDFETKYIQQQQQQQLLLQQQQHQKQQLFQEQQKSYVSALVNVTVQIITSIWPNSNTTPQSHAPSSNITSTPIPSNTPLSATSIASLSPPPSPTDNNANAATGGTGQQQQQRTGNHSATTSRPIANLNTFLHHILKHSRTTHSTLQLAVFYLFRIRTVVQEKRHQDAYISCGRRMFLAALITAHKFLQDKTYKNTAWSKVSGLPVHEITRAEKIMLQLLDYRLYVKKDTYDQWIYMLQSHIKVMPVSTRQPVEYHTFVQDKLHQIAAQQSLPSPPAEHMSPQKRKNSFMDDCPLARKKRC